MKKSFVFAFKGVAACLKTERNFRFHVMMTFYVIVVGAAAGLTKTEWLVVLLCIGAVTGAEIFNTAIEKLCDTLHPGTSSGIGLVKDMTAGGVFTFALTSAVIGVIIYADADKFQSVWHFAQTHAALAAVVLLTLPLNFYLVFRRYGND